MNHHTESHRIDLQRAVHFFETLTLDSLTAIGQIYAADARFKDPFNDVRGLEAVAQIYRHMFTQVDQPRFSIATSVLQGDDAFLTWNFLFRMKRFSRKEQCIHGATHLRFDSEGRIARHRDYWDAAEELYEKLPLLGEFMRLLKRHARS